MISMIAIRKMTVSDLPEVFSVRVSTIENVVTIGELEEEYELTPETLAKAMDRSVQGWVCESRGKIVGFAMGDAESGEMTVLAVLPDYERRGIGAKLLTTVQDWLFDVGHDELWLLTTSDPNVRAYGFYSSQGWTATGELIGEDEEKFVLRRQ